MCIYVHRDLDYVVLVSFQIYFGTMHARIYLVADYIGTNCVTGMSCLFRCSVLEGAGGLASLSQYLAEDFYLAKTVLDR